MRRLLALSALLLWLPLHGEPLPLVRLQIGMHLIQAELANTPAARSLGLMHRTELKKNHGMWFEFERAETQAMWMRNTPLPLAVAFVDERGEILNIAEMKPLTDDTHASSGFAKYALEMRSGWFAERGIKRGDKVKLLPEAARH